MTSLPNISRIRVGKQGFPIFLAAVSLLLLTIFLWWHWQLGMTRYFDVDEYAHLHWTAKMLQGKRPYVDFLTFFPPGYWLFLSLAFIGGWGTTAPFFTARMLQFFVFAGMCVSAAYLFYLVRGKSWAAVLVAAFLAFLPLPFDKYLEIRPDSLAALLVLLGMVFQVVWMEKRRLPVIGFLAGISYAASLLVLTKTLPNVGIAVFILLASEWQRLSGKPTVRIRKLVGEIRFPLTGFLAPVGVFAVWVLTLGHPDLVIYSLTALPVEANKISQYFIMMPNLFFWPNGIYYGQNGWNPVMYANHIVWVIGGVYGVYRLLAPFLPRGRKGAWSEFLIAAMFVIQIYFFVEVFPLRHAQYLIPIGIFVAFYTADAVNDLWRFLSRPFAGRVVFTVLFLAMSYELYTVFISDQAIKLTWTNDKEMQQLAALYRTIPQDAYLLDLDGRFLYNPDPYYACCIPFGQSETFFSRPLPSLPAALDATRTKYINQGELKRVGTLPAGDQQYIGGAFTEMPDYPIILTRP